MMTGAIIVIHEITAMIVTVTTGTAITIATPIMIMIATGAATDTIARMIIVIETTATVRAA